MRRVIGPFAGMAVGCMIGFGTVLAIGAAAQPARHFPRYVVTSGGASLLITDNDSGKLFIYTNVSAGPQGQVVHQLHHSLDLTTVGQQELKPVEIQGR